jgi:hypothetical protein
MASGRWAQWVKAFPFTTLRGPQVGEFFSQADFATLPHVNALCTARKTFLIFFFFFFSVFERPIGISSFVAPRMV